MFSRSLILLSITFTLLAIIHVPTTQAHRFEPPVEIEVVEGKTAELLVVDDTGCAANLHAMIEDTDIATVSPASASERVRKKFTITGMLGAAGQETELVIDVMGVGTNPEGEPCNESSYTFLTVRVLPNFKAAGRQLAQIEEEEFESLKLDLKSLLEDFEMACKELIEALEDGDIDAEEAAVELLDGTSDALNDAYLRAYEAAGNVVERAAQNPQTAVALAERDSCADDPSCKVGGKLAKFIDNTTPGGCADWDDFSHDVQNRLTKTAAKIAEEVKRWAKKIESQSKQAAKQDPDEPVVDIRPQTTLAPLTGLAPPAANPDEPPKFTTLTQASVHTGKVTRVQSDGSAIREETHTLRVAGIHDPAYGSLEIIVKGTDLKGNSYEKSAVLGSFPDCKFDFQFVDIPKGDYLVTLRPVNPGPVVSSSSFVSVR